jgi:hypothetical protein
MELSKHRPGQEFRYTDEGGNLWHGFATGPANHYRLFPVCKGNRHECIDAHTGMEQEPVFLKPETEVKSVDGKVKV